MFYSKFAMHIQSIFLLLPLVSDAFIPSRLELFLVKRNIYSCPFPCSSSLGSFSKPIGGRSIFTDLEMTSEFESCWYSSKKTVLNLHVALLILIAPVFSLPVESNAVLSNEQRVVAEAWSIVDSTFVDRTFNNNDWLKLRQTLVKRQYGSRDEVYVSASKQFAHVELTWSNRLTKPYLKRCSRNLETSTQGLSLPSSTRPSATPSWG